MVNIYMSKKLVLFSLIFSLLLACGLKELNAPPISEPVSSYEYEIGLEDVLQIHVWKQPELSVTVPVRSDGNISVPLINEIQAAGLTPIQLKTEITDKLAKFVDDPTVSVIVTEINSLKIYVSGNVVSPGVYKINDRVTLIEALSLAGGLKKLADSKRIRIIRKTNNEQKIYQVNYKTIISDGDIQQNIFIYPGDSIVVP